MNEYGKALVEITSCNLKKAVSKIPTKYFEMDIEALEKEAKPKELHKALKITFQAELESAMMEQRFVIKKNLCKGVCHENWLDRSIIKDEKLLAWLLVPSIKDELKVKRAYQDGVDEVRKIMSDIQKEIADTQDFEERKKLRDQYHNYFKTLAARAAPIVQRQQIHQVVENRKSQEDTQSDQEVTQLLKDLLKQNAGSKQIIETTEVSSNKKTTK